MQTYSPYASYALVEAIDTEQGLRWQTQYKVPYDYDYDYEAVAKLTRQLSLH